MFCHVLCTPSSAVVVVYTSVCVSLCCPLFDLSTRLSNRANRTEIPQRSAAAAAAAMQESSSVPTRRQPSPRQDETMEQDTILLSTDSEVPPYGGAASTLAVLSGVCRLSSVVVDLAVVVVVRAVFLCSRYAIRDAVQCTTFTSRTVLLVYEKRSQRVCVCTVLGAFAVDTSMENIRTTTAALRVTRALVGQWIDCCGPFFHIILCCFNNSNQNHC